MQKLRHAKIAIFGIGGVGGYALEALARAGVENLYIYDFDRVMPSNINRQIYALDSTIDRDKADVALNRVLDINPDASVNLFKKKLTIENIGEVFTNDFTYAIDAIDDIPAKVELIFQLSINKKIFISSMGAGNRLDPGKIKIEDIAKTSYCPLAKRVRKQLRGKGLYKGIMTVYSTESPDRRIKHEPGSPVGSISYLPGIFGLTAAGYIIQKILNENNY